MSLFAGQDQAWGEYHSRSCQHLPAIHYAFQAKQVSAADAHAGLLLLKLVALHFHDQVPDTRARLLSAQHLNAEQIRVVDPSSAFSRISLFFELLPRPLSNGDKVVLDVIASKVLDLPKTALEFLLCRFSGNNHVISDERLKPIGHAILYVSRQVVSNGNIV